MKQYIPNTLGFIVLVAVLAMAQEAIFGPPLPNNQFFHGADSTGRFRALIGVDENDDVVIDPDDIDVRFGNGVTVDGALTQTGNAALSGTLTVTGDATFNSEVHGSQGTAAASAETLTLGGDGTIYGITGTTQTDMLTTTGFQNGSEVKLLIAGGPITFTNNTTPTGLTARFLFDSSGNHIASTNEVMAFVLTTANSVRAWRYQGASNR